MGEEDGAGYEGKEKTSLIITSIFICVGLDNDRCIIHKVTGCIPSLCCLIEQNCLHLL